MRYKVCVIGVSDSVVYVDDLDDIPERFKTAVALLNAIDTPSETAEVFWGHLKDVGGTVNVAVPGKESMYGERYDRAFYIHEDFLTLQSEERA